MIERVMDINPFVTLALGLFGGGALTAFVVALYNARRADRGQEFTHLNTIIGDLRTRIIALEAGLTLCHENHAIDKEKLGRLETGLANCEEKHKQDSTRIYELRRDLHAINNRIAACPQCHGQLPVLPPVPSDPSASSPEK